MPAKSMLILAALGGLCTARAVAAQAVGQADVLIQSLTVNRTRGLPTLAQPGPRGTLPGPRGVPAPGPIATGGLAIQVVVFSYWDDDAQNVRVNVFFPPETSVISMPPNCAVPATGGSTNPFASCTLGTLGVNASQTVNITITMPPSYVVPRVGVFAWAETPDPNTANNHAEQVAP
jgi:hypothetical protein